MVCHLCWSPHSSFSPNGLSQSSSFNLDPLLGLCPGMDPGLGLLTCLELCLGLVAFLVTDPWPDSSSNSVWRVSPVGNWLDPTGRCRLTWSWWRWLWWGWWWKLTWSSSCSLQPGDGVSVSTADLFIFVSSAMIKISISMKIALGALLDHNCSNLGLVFPAGSARLVWVSVSIRGSKLPSVRSLLIGSGLLDHNATKSLSYINATYFPPQQILFYPWYPFHNGQVNTKWVKI